MRLLVLLLVVITFPAYAYRREYVVTHDGARKAGSEVCFYRGASAADVFSLYFSYDQVACLPADEVLDLPPGLFHAFARHADGYVSGHRDFFVYRGPPAPEEGYERLEIPLEVGGWADLSAILQGRKPHETVGVWIAPTPTHSGTFLPLVDGETSVMVPARRAFVPMLIANGAPVAIGDAYEAGAGARRAVEPFRTVAGSSDVMVWLKVDAARTVEEEAKRPLPPPLIRLVAGDATFEPLLPLYAGTGATHTLMFFKGVPSGPARIEVTGKTWVNAETGIAVVPAAATIVREPIMLVAGASLELTWDSTAGEPDPSCGDAPGPQLVATLASCPDPERCTPVARRTVAFTPAGSVGFPGIPSGVYRITLVPPFAKPVVHRVELAVGEETVMSVSLPRFQVFGTVTVNDKPVRAFLRFESGVAWSDETGRYTAALAADPSTNLVEVELCADGRTITYIPDRRIAENAAFDIDIQERPLRVTVVSRNVAVPAAAVRFAPVKTIGGEPSPYYSSESSLTDEKGQVTFAGVPIAKPLLVCATHRAHKESCLGPLTPAQIRSGEVVLALEPGALRGRVAGHEGTGILAIVSSRGLVAEQAMLSPDGAFAFDRFPAGDDYFVYASSIRPLTVLPIPARKEGELLVTLPAAPVRSFRVTVSEMPTDEGYIGVFVDGRYIPLDLLAFHHDHRGGDVILQRGGSLMVRDIAATGAITVAFAPDIPAGGRFADPFTLPQFSNAPRQPVVGTAVVLTAH